MGGGLFGLSWLRKKILKKKMDESERFVHMFEKSIGLVRKWSEIRVGLMVA